MVRWIKNNFVFCCALFVSLLIYAKVIPIKNYGATNFLFLQEERIVAGNGTVEDVEMLGDLSDTISSTALCGLGKTASFPVQSTLRYFKDEYMAHVVDKKCPAGDCQALKNYYIDKDLCKGCSKCARNCPVNAISGVIKQPFTIDTKKCIKCGACVDNCAFNAVKEG